MITKDVQQLLFYLVGKQQGEAVESFRNDDITKEEYDEMSALCYKATTELIHNREK
jgi:hypothetical protein